MRIILCIASVLYSIPAITQHTVGLLSHDQTRTYDGYNLLYPHNQPNVYLLDNCGAIVHVWEDDPSFRPGNTAYLLVNGNLVKTKRPAAVGGDRIWAGGGGATVEIRSWDNELLWSFTMNDSLYRLHHDIQPMPNGNILMIAWELKTREEAIAVGRDTSLLPDGELWPDFIIEVQPIGGDSFEIVWEWHTWDHLVQDFDPTKENYGDVAEHPELIDINHVSGDGEADWMHSNSVDYHAGWDQVMLCSPDLSEVWIIDHTTTTEEAASHSGGFSGRGGDLMYRFGNLAVYNQGGEEDQLLFGPHDAHWIDDFVPTSHPDYGKVAVYNNRVGPDYSLANILELPVFDDYMWWYPMNGDIWDPAEFDWTYIHPDTTPMHSTGLSSVQPLANGNTLICSGRRGYAFEITPDEDIVWEYRTPLRGGSPVPQGEELDVSDNLTFRVNRYPMDFPAFAGKDLSPKGFIELDPDTTFCSLISSTNSPASEAGVVIYPNPADDFLVVEWKDGGMGYIDIYHITGQQVTSNIGYGGRNYIDVSTLIPGLYFVRVDGGLPTKFIVR